MHTPVLLHEVITNLALTANAHCIDGTVGLGGHARRILESTSPGGKLIGCDRDASALLLATQELKEFKERFIPVNDSYANLLSHADELAQVTPVHGIVLDLGLSSMQLDLAERGFSFRLSGPLDMRFDQSRGATASDMLNDQSQEELQRIFTEYGEEPFAGKIARAIVERRREEPFHTTDDLMHLVEDAVPQRFQRARAGSRRIHPATRVFQALRIAVNHELDQLRTFLPIALDLLAPGGRLAIISFHSLEDRMVKQFFHYESLDCVCPPELPECRCAKQPRVKKITKKPIIPTEEEIQTNPRSRSAKLRVIEKI